MLFFRCVIAGTSEGRLGLFDLRGRKGFLVHVFKGFAGMFLARRSDSVNHKSVVLIDAWVLAKLFR